MNTQLTKHFNAVNQALREVVGKRLCQLSEEQYLSKCNGTLTIAQLEIMTNEFSSHIRQEHFEELQNLTNQYTNQVAPF